MLRLLNPGPFLVYSGLLMASLIYYFLPWEELSEEVLELNIILWVSLAFVWFASSYLLMMLLGLLGLVGARAEKRFWVSRGMVGYFAYSGPDACDRIRMHYAAEGLIEAPRTYRNAARWIGKGALRCTGLVFISRLLTQKA